MFTPYRSPISSWVKSRTIRRAVVRIQVFRICNDCGLERVPSLAGPQSYVAKALSAQVPAEVPALRIADADRPCVSIIAHW